MFSRHNVERELEEELRYHLKRQIEKGMPASARYAAVQSNDIEQRKEEYRDMRGLISHNALQAARPKRY
jgi:hypothetical protein